jgi:DNA repair exonuclease SbcCD ATPase subunit
MNTREQMQITETLAALQARGDHFTRQLLQEKQRVSQLEAALNDLTEEISEVRCENKIKAIGLLNKHATTTKNAYQRVDGLDPTRLAEINQKKLVSNLEGRLNKALVRQSSIEGGNSAIKDKIDKLRRKVANDSINRKVMEKRLKQIQDGVDNIMKRAASVSEQRDKIISLHNQLEKENLDEREKFNEKYMELSKYIDEQNQVLESSINQVTSDVDNKLQCVERRQTIRSNADKVDNLNPVDEMKAIDAKLLDLERQVGTRKESLELVEEKNAKYKESFERLHQVSGLECTDDIIKAFVYHEDESFSMFNYIQTVNQGCDNLFEERMKLEREISSYDQEQNRKENDRKLVVDGYTKRLAEVREEKERLQEANRERKLTVSEIANNVHRLHVKLKCSHLENDAPVARIPRASSERKITMFAGELISGQKILHHMQLIERRAIQIIAEYARTPDDKTKRIQGRPSELPVSLYESNSYMFSFHGSFDILHFIFNSRPSRLIDS